MQQWACGAGQSATHRPHHQGSLWKIGMRITAKINAQQSEKNSKKKEKEKEKEHDEFDIVFAQESEEEKKSEPIARWCLSWSMATVEKVSCSGIPS